ncbi:MAG TPA: DUF4893 domain-containing protein [Allosphingosinicella sp.]|jgi:hypothetical protein
MSIRAAAILLASLAAAGPAPAGGDEAQPESCTAPTQEGCRAPRGERRVKTWRQVATEDDRRRLREWRDAFVAALAEARASGHGEAVVREGALLDPDAAVPGAALPAGEFRCRTIKLGSRGEGGLDYVAYPDFRCRAGPGLNGVTLFAKLTGSQRPVGRLFPEHDRRQIFLGTLQLSDERQVLTYGRDRERNMAGILERIGERRWRILLPYPHFESTLDVIEITLPPESR